MNRSHTKKKSQSCDFIHSHEKAKIRKRKIKLNSKIRPTNIIRTRQATRFLMLTDLFPTSSLKLKF